MIDKLPPREREVFDVLLSQGEATALQISERMPEAPSKSAIRAMLVRLERKGVIRHRVVDGSYVYSPKIAKRAEARRAAWQLVKTFFDGSPVDAATALLGMSEHIDPRELDRLEALIAKARREQMK